MLILILIIVVGSFTRLGLGLFGYRKRKLWFWRPDKSLRQNFILSSIFFDNYYLLKDVKSKRERSEVMLTKVIWEIITVLGANIAIIFFLYI